MRALIAIIKFGKRNQEWIEAGYNYLFDFLKVLVPPPSISMSIDFISIHYCQEPTLSRVFFTFSRSVCVCVCFEEEIMCGLLYTLFEFR